MKKHLSGPEKSPKSGNPAQQLIVFLHGLGADGNDLLSLAPFFQTAFPNAHFASPNAPFDCDMATPSFSYNRGFQWFSLLEYRLEPMLAGMKISEPILNEYLDAKLAELNLPMSKLALIGFSQGTMMSLHTMLRRSPACGAIVGFSGALVGEENLAQEIKSRPPVCLIHGDADMVVPYASLAAAEKILRDEQVPVQVHTRPRLGHSIDEEGIAIALRFLQANLL